MSEDQRLITVGRRKTSVARVYLEEGGGNVRVNGRELVDYFPRYADQVRVLEVFRKLGLEDRYDLNASVSGGGIASQSAAIRLGVARFFLATSPDLRPKLKTAGFLTRDPRAKERKKYGQKRARKRFQFSKR